MTSTVNDFNAWDPNWVLLEPHYETVNTQREGIPYFTALNYEAFEDALMGYIFQRLTEDGGHYVVDSFEYLWKNTTWRFEWVKGATDKIRTMPQIVEDREKFRIDVGILRNKIRDLWRELNAYITEHEPAFIALWTEKSFRKEDVEKILNLAYSFPAKEDRIILDQHAWRLPHQREDLYFKEDDGTEHMKNPLRQMPGMCFPDVVYVSNMWQAERPWQEWDGEERKWPTLRRGKDSTIPTCDRDINWTPNPVWRWLKAGYELEWWPLILPELNVARLTDKRTFLRAMHLRARLPPERFWRGDWLDAYGSRTIRSTYTRVRPRDTMTFEGRHVTTDARGPTYGEVRTLSNKNNWKREPSYTDLVQGDSVVVGEGINLLWAQYLTYQFLLNCIKQKATWDGWDDYHKHAAAIEKVHSKDQLDAGYRRHISDSRQGLAEDPHMMVSQGVSGILLLEWMHSVAVAREQEAKTHWRMLRLCPRYFREAVFQEREHHWGNMHVNPELGENEETDEPPDLQGQTEFRKRHDRQMCDWALKEVVVGALGGLAFWSRIKEMLAGLRGRGEREYITERPKDGKEIIKYMRLYHIVKTAIWFIRQNFVQWKFQASPQQRIHYTREQQRKENKKFAQQPPSLFPWLFTELLPPMEDEKLRTTTVNVLYLVAHLGSDDATEILGIYRMMEAYSAYLRVIEGIRADWWQDTFTSVTVWKWLRQIASLAEVLRQLEGLYNFGNLLFLIDRYSNLKHSMEAEPACELARSLRQGLEPPGIAGRTRLLDAEEEMVVDRTSWAGDVEVRERVELFRDELEETPTPEYHAAVIGWQEDLRKLWSTWLDPYVARVLRGNPQPEKWFDDVSKKVEEQCAAERLPRSFDDYTKWLEAQWEEIRDVADPAPEENHHDDDKEDDGDVKMDDADAADDVAGDVAKDLADLLGQVDVDDDVQMDDADATQPPAAPPPPPPPRAPSPPRSPGSSVVKLERDVFRVAQAIWRLRGDERPRNTVSWGEFTKFMAAIGFSRRPGAGSAQLFMPSPTCKLSK
ncbi:hypothetical protein NKR23_g6831 [Pleurostoma richardsiae]|uniref:Uncharacterized protein n=1 Tax=Pleurostoma richardsiae TaxID=41990 RepID=A0AA38RCU5_9PEZI|nr:hypothetical protein NKR23_g6831 [Pleurostoma richardsiae]